jgi:DNA-binding transcriptional LysR family regulator
MEAAWADLRALATGETGALRVGTYQSAGARILPEPTRRFVAERPGVEVHLTESGSTASCSTCSSAASSTSR